MSDLQSNFSTEFLRNPLGEISNRNQGSPSNLLGYEELKKSKPLETKSLKSSENAEIGKKEKKEWKETSESQKNDSYAMSKNRKNSSTNSTFSNQNYQNLHLNEDRPIESIALSKIQNTCVKNEVSLKMFSGNSKAFLTEGLNENQMVRLKVVRKTNIWENNVFGILEGSSGNYQVVNFEREFKFIGTKARIVVSPYKKAPDVENHIEKEVIEPFALGYIESNLSGSIFNVYENQTTNSKPNLIATISYHEEIEKLSGPRKVSIFIKNENANIKFESDENLKSYLKANPLSPNVHSYESLSPQYDEKSKSYILKFKSIKSPQPSTHNLILVDERSRAGLKFYKSKEKEYILECFSSVKPLIGLAYCYSSFVWKLASQ